MPPPLPRPHQHSPHPGTQTMIPASIRAFRGTPLALLHYEGHRGLGAEDKKRQREKAWASAGREKTSLRGEDETSKPKFFSMNTSRGDIDAAHHLMLLVSHHSRLDLIFPQCQLQLQLYLPNTLPLLTLHAQLRMEVVEKREKAREEGDSAPQLHLRRLAMLSEHPLAPLTPPAAKADMGERRLQGHVAICLLVSAPDSPSRCIFHSPVACIRYHADLPRLKNELGIFGPPGLTFIKARRWKFLECGGGDKEKEKEDARENVEEERYHTHSLGRVDDETHRHKYNVIVKETHHKQEALMADLELVDQGREFVIQHARSEATLPERRHSLIRHGLFLMSAYCAAVMVYIRPEEDTERGRKEEQRLQERIPEEVE
ncbi:hypothetical protein DXG01_009044 [Tephrocybe rancida]|nr:hypothetical protein DXG01_009044 [Tephrocybe rancida]